MKKKGFTLVELLAVIVILAVIAVIAVPIIIGIVKDAKYKAAVESLKGYLDAAEKTITLNELKKEEDFPEADNNGCYNLKDLDKKIEVKGNKPTGIKDSDKMCFKDGNVKDMDEVIIDGYEAEVKDYKLYVGDKEVKEETSSSSTGPAISYTGIPSKEYSVNEKVSYLGYNWYVMKDNGDNSMLVLDGHLSADELRNNLPNDLPSAMISSPTMPICLDGGSTYCVNSYSWNRSTVKPTIENWISNKMQEKGLNKEIELKLMAFNDGTENTTGYIRIPTLDEVKAYAHLTDTINGFVYNYDIPNTSWVYTNFDYWLLTGTGGTAVSVYWKLDSNRADGIYGNTTTVEHAFQFLRVRPVINVNEK